MANPRLGIDECSRNYHIGWYFPDEGEFGAYLGDTVTSKKPNPDDQDEWENWIATQSVREAFPDVHRGLRGFEFETRKEAQAAMRIAKAAMKQNKLMPEWATKALAAGWKPPKGWRT
jgi:hypothetical protein